MNTFYIPDINPLRFDGDIMDHIPSTYDEADAYEFNNLVFHSFEAAYNYAIGFISSKVLQGEEM